MEYKRLIKRYLTGDDVLYVKQRLVELGYLHAATTRMFGNESYAAAKAFQTAASLEADGIVGRLTWAALFGETMTDKPTATENPTLAKVKAFLDERVANGDIYVWGGSGQSNITEAWIRAKEARNQNGANADRAVATWRKRLAAGFSGFRAYDCSGLVSGALISVGLMSSRRDCDGLWGRCTRLNAPKNGALLFRVSSSNAEDETHVGMYFDGCQYHAKGRDDGVVKEKYKASYWAKVGWFKGMPE